MKSKKVTMLAAALVVAVVAFAAVGYATAYKAETSNSKNNVTATYVTLSQTGNAKYAEGSFINNNYYNTETVWENSAEKITYTVTGDGEPVKIKDDVYGYIISKDGTTGLTLTLKDTVNGTYTLTVSTTENMGSGTNKIDYYVGVLNGTTYNWSAAAGSYDSTEDGSATTWTINGVTANTEGIAYTVVVAARGSTTATPVNVPEATFGFTATSTS